MAIEYRPTHQHQLQRGDPHRGVNCTAYVAAMAIDLATLGGSRVTGEYIRSISSEPSPDPESPGLNLPQVVQAAARVGVDLDDVTGIDWWTLVKRVREQRRGAIVQLTRGHLTGFLCGESFTGPHAVLLVDITPGGSTLVYDPLCEGGQWISPNKVRSAAQAFGEDTGLKRGQLRVALTRTVPTLA